MDTGTEGTTLRWHGQQQRLTDRGIVHMGARAYSPATGRFLSVDPVEGGCANDYVYVYGDPVNYSDTSGLGLCENKYVRGFTGFFGDYDLIKGIFDIIQGGDEDDNERRLELMKDAALNYGQKVAETAIEEALIAAGKATAAKVVGGVLFIVGAGSTYFDYKCENPDPPPVQLAPGPIGYTPSTGVFA